MLQRPPQPRNPGPDDFLLSGSNQSRGSRRSLVQPTPLPQTTLGTLDPRGHNTQAVLSRPDSTGGPLSLPTLSSIPSGRCRATSQYRCIVWSNSQSRGETLRHCTMDSNEDTGSYGAEPPETTLPSCDSCRTRKLKCSRDKPLCSNCTRLSEQ